ncbi:MAG: ABC transporter substrate-binding protein [Bdellovibrionales bacterium]|nr:ABC transporter substrate-binding protein [Bdellovibrionales bacterium]
MKPLKATAVALIITALSAHAVELPKAELALNWKPEPEFGGFYEAALEKLYDKAGIEVTVLPGGAGQPVAQMVAGKKVKYGIVAADELILARAQGAKLVALFAVYQDDPQGFMLHPDRKVKNLKDLFQSKGTIALQKGLPYTLWLEKQYAPIKAQIVPYTGGITQFLASAKGDKSFAQQCFIFSEPIAARREKVNPKTFMISESGFNPYLSVLVTHEDVITQERSQVEAVMKGTKEGWEHYLKDPKKTNVAMQKLNPSLDLDTFNEASKAQMPFVQSKDTKKYGLGVMTEARWKTLYDQLIALKLVKEGMKPSEFFYHPVR